MANMSYCRFENTSRDLADCVEALENEGLDSLRGNSYEMRGAERIYDLCQAYIELYESEVFEKDDDE